MTDYQKKTAWLVIGLGLAYFILFIFPNNTGAKDMHMLFVLSTDEHITYPYTLRMVIPGQDIFETLYHWIAYQDYHYGYPFYLLSALVLLPVQLVTGGITEQHTQLNLLLLRQFINVLPMTAAIIFLVYLQTRFRSRWRAVVLFIFLATVQGVFRTNICWWHPDSLAILAAVLTFFFLDRDRLQFKRHFLLAAVTCGLAAGIKVFGFFFFLTIAAYLVVGVAKKKIEIRRALIAAFLFIAVMAAALVISNPLLIPEQSRQNIFNVQAKISYETTHGWSDEDEYHTGLSAWLPYLEKWYGQHFFLLFALVSLISGCFWGSSRTVNRLILCWVLPYAFYLFMFIAVKPDHYWLPVLLPLFSSILSSFPQFDEKNGRLFMATEDGGSRWLVIIQVLALLVILSQFVMNLAGDARLYASAMNQERLLELNIHE